MKNIWLYIKKFFSILFSIIYGVFRKESHEQSVTKTDEDDYKVEKNKNDTYKVVVRDDEKSEKTQTIFDNKKKDEEIIYYAKRDIQRLLFIQKKLENVENNIKYCDNLEKIYELEKEYKNAETHYNKIVVLYDKVESDSLIIKDIKNVITDTEQLLKKTEKSLSNKAYKLKTEQQEKKQIEETEKEKKPVIDNVEEKEFIDEEEQIDEIIENDEEKQALYDEFFEKQPTKEEIVDDEKEFFEKLAKEKQDFIDDYEEKQIKDEDNKEKDTLKKVAIVNEHSNIKEQNNSMNLDRIQIILAKAHSLATSSNPTILLQLNPNVAVSSALFINNEIRRARSLTGAKVKKLTIDKIISSVGLNKELQVKYTMNNSLKEIRKLKSELRGYGNIEQALNALNELDELEMELIMQLNELQNQNNLQQGMHR